MKNRTFGILIIVILAIYIVSPIDFISETIPVIGLLDDAIAVLMLAKQVVNVFSPITE